MFFSASKLSAPLVGALFLACAGAASGASAAPLSGPVKIAEAQSELVIKADHRRHRDGRHWNGPRHGYHKLGPRQIRRSLRHRGFHGIKIVNRRDRVYIVHARGWRGFPMRLVVDARNARILRSKPVGRHFYPHRHW